jgi:bifunctional ADP-heptose synthase (sugar kinase/adenylyltransferase)
MSSDADLRQVLVIGDSWWHMKFLGVADPSPVTHDALNLQAAVVEQSGGVIAIARDIAAFNQHVVCLSSIGQDGPGARLDSDCRNSHRVQPRLTVGHVQTAVHMDVHHDARPVTRLRHPGVPTANITAFLYKEVPEAIQQQPCGVAVIFDWGYGLFAGQAQATTVATCRAAGLATLLVGRAAQLQTCGATVVIMPASDAATFAELHNLLHPGLLIDAPNVNTVLLKLLRQKLQCAVAVLVDHYGGLLVDAGDMVITVPGPLVQPDLMLALEVTAATLAVALRTGMDLEKAVQTAHSAIRTAGKSRQLTQVALGLDNMVAARDGKLSKLTALPMAAAISQHLQSQQKRVAVVDGKFAHLHCGHLALLRAAAEQADCVIVLLQSTGATDLEVRIQQFRQLTTVDMVVTVLDAEGIAVALGKIRPTFLLKGAEYQTQDIPGEDVVAKHGGIVRFLAMQETHATSHLHHSSE